MKKRLQKQSTRLLEFSLSQKLVWHEEGTRLDSMAQVWTGLSQPLGRELPLHLTNELVMQLLKED